MNETRGDSRAKRRATACAEPVEASIIKGLLRSTPGDIRRALELAAFNDFDRALLRRLARERLMTGWLHRLLGFAELLRTGHLRGQRLSRAVRCLAKR